MICDLVSLLWSTCLGAVDYLLIGILRPGRGRVPVFRGWPPERGLKVAKGTSAAQIVLDSLQRVRFAKPGGSRVVQLFFYQGREKRESRVDCACAKRFEQMVLDLDAVLDRWQCGHGLQVEGVALAKVWIRLNALFIVVLEHAPQREGHHASGYAVAQCDADRARTRHRGFKRLEWILKQWSLPRDQDVRRIGRCGSVPLLFNRCDL